MVKTSSVPASVLSKFHDAIFYYWVRESHACGIITVQLILGYNSLEGLLSKNAINRDLSYKISQEIFYNYEEKTEDRDLEVGKKRRVCRFPFHMGGIRYLLHKHNINTEMQVCCEIVVGLNQ